MKPDAEYIKTLLDAFRNSPTPTTNIYDLEHVGISYKEPIFEFHMHLLVDDGYIESEFKRGYFGLEKSVYGDAQWSVIPLRLTASGHEFAEALDKPKAFETVRKNFVGASLSTIKDVVVAIGKAELAKHFGVPL